MDVRAILIVGEAIPEPVAGSRTETIGGVPIAYLDVLGMPVLRRVLARLRRCGVTGTTLITDASLDAEPFLKRAISGIALSRVNAPSEQLWQAAETTFQNYAEGGAELVITLRIGPYTDVDYEELIQHHLDHRCAVTMAVDSSGTSLDLFVLSACSRKDAITLFRSHLRQLRRECQPFPVTSYTNRLRNAADLRYLAMDGLLRKNSVLPVGNEIKPGVWVGEHAHIHRRARLVAPAYVGAHAKIRAAAVITRGAVIEQRAEVDCGTVVENSTVLAFTYVGAGLDVMHSVVGLRHLSHLLRKVEVEISDGKLVGISALRAVSRIAGSTAGFFALIPKRIRRRLSASPELQSGAKGHESGEQEKAPAETTTLGASGSTPEASELPLAVARRYGNQ
jgi:carbonic anhydrase/acetyltransferase-like protein (isoleucine patch superfamily)